ncbi:hypothetical protein ACHAQD_011582 [Fusarium lateritium]
MTSYSSDEFMADWRYAVEQDFTTSAGEPYPYADSGRLQWGNELKKITYKKPPHLGCVSHDGKLLALAVEHDIHVVDAQTWETLTVLKGHTSKVDAVAFRPNDSRTLISCDVSMYDIREPNRQSTIILWNIEEEQATTSIEEGSLNSAARAAASVVNYTGRGEKCGELLLLDIEEKKLLQKRLLSVDNSTSKEEVRDMMKGFVGTYEVKFVDSGNKLAVWTFGDCSIEVYDINREVKWRFARGGTEDGPEADKWRDDKGKVTSKQGYTMLTWEDQTKDVLQLASLDFDGVRIWEIPS